LIERMLGKGCNGDFACGLCGKSGSRRRGRIWIKTAGFAGSLRWMCCWRQKK